MFREGGQTMRRTQSTPTQRITPAQIERETPLQAMQVWIVKIVIFVCMGGMIAGALLATALRGGR